MNVYSLSFDTVSSASIVFSLAGDPDLLLSKESDSFISPDLASCFGDLDLERFSGDFDRRSADLDFLSGVLDRRSLDLDCLSLDLDLLASGVLERLSRDLDLFSGDRARFSGVGDRFSSLDRSADLDLDLDLRADRL